MLPHAFPENKDLFVHDHSITIIPKYSDTQAISTSTKYLWKETLGIHQYVLKFPGDYNVQQTLRTTVYRSITVKLNIFNTVFVS